MRPSTVLSLGCFLLALGLGWYTFTNVVTPANIFGWTLITAGAGVIASSLISWRRPHLPVRGVVSGLAGGLVLSMLITSGFGFITGWNGSYRAEGTESYTGPVTANSIYLDVDSFNGPILVSTWDEDGYNVSIKIVAKGFSQQNAEDNLNDLKIEFGNQTVQDQLRLTLGYDVSSLTHSRYSIWVEVHLPADAPIDLDLDSSNGGIQLTGVEGESINIETSNGRLVFDEVFSDSITGATSNGGIEGTVEAQNTALSTSNGGISLTLPCSASGQYDLGTSNGNVKLNVSSSSEVGYDLDLSTSNGNIDITLSDLEYSENRETSKEARSEGFSGKAVQITIKASTSNGNMQVETP